MNQTELQTGQGLLAPSARPLAAVRIRQLGRSDLPALEWEGAYRHFRRLYETAYRRARQGNAVLWVLDGGDGLLIGQLFVLLRSAADPSAADGETRGFIHSFRVRPEYRDRGLGSRLLRAAEEDLVRRGFRWASLNVARDNHGAIRLYERKGYRRIRAEEGRWTYVDHEGVERRVYEPSWRMRKRLRRLG